MLEIRSALQALWKSVGCLLLILIGALPAAAAEPLSESETRRLLIDGEVLNSETSQPIEKFRVIPGVRYNRTPGSRGNLAVWQPHMIREMNDGVFHWPRTRGYDEMRFRIEADGFRAATTTWLGKGGPHLRMKIHLRPDDGIKGVVVSPSGLPAAGATFAIGLPNRSVVLDGDKVIGHDEAPLDRLSDQWRRPQTIQANQQGEFVLPYESDPSAVLCVVHETGYLEKSFSDWVSIINSSSDSMTLPLEPWAQITGRVYWKDRPGQNETIRLLVHRSSPYPGLVASYAETTSDADGNFHFKHVPPGECQLGHLVHDGDTDSVKRSSVAYEYPDTHLNLNPGQIKRVEFGGTGIDVVGHLVGLESYDGVTVSIRPPAPDVWNMQRFGGKPLANGIHNGYAALKKTDYAPLYFRESLKVDQDGHFRIQDVMTGAYNVWVQGAVGSGRFVLNSDEDEPFDIGEIKVISAKQVAPLMKGE